MEDINLKRFKSLLKFTHSHINGKYTLYDNEVNYHQIPVRALCDEELIY